MYTYSNTMQLSIDTKIAHECNNYNLYKRGGTVQKHAKGHHFERSYRPNDAKGHNFERSYRPNDAKLKGDYMYLATCWWLLAVEVRKKFEMVVLERGYTWARLSYHVH